MSEKLYFYDLDTPVDGQEYLFLQSMLPEKRLEELKGKKESFVREKMMGECLTRMAACEWFWKNPVCQGIVKGMPFNGEAEDSGGLPQKTDKREDTYVLPERLADNREEADVLLERMADNWEEADVLPEQITVVRMFRKEVSEEQISWMRGLQIQQEKGGKKYFANYPDIYFNVSHSGHRLVCAVSDVPVGVDIEKPAEAKNVIKIVKRFFHAKEIERFEMLAKEGVDPAVEFQRLWTMKEAYLKCTGAGLSGGMDGYRFEKDENTDEYYVVEDAPSEVIIRHTEYKLRQFMDEENYVTTICIKKMENNA